jgi:dGTPase
MTELKCDLDRREKAILAPQAALSREGIRQSTEKREIKGYRQSFSLDVDRILHSMAYTRYIDKTQVFYLIENDHITHRVLHVQLVSKIARTIGRYLNLNQDLIEAIALGHDIGHAPFGHDGETFLTELCQEHGIGHFLHNVQSVQFLSRVERKGRGWNLCLQTLDGILCHDGEVHNQILHPDKHKTFTTLAQEISAKKKQPSLTLYPMTLEGCVVRMADTISYIGRDIEDAIRLGIIQRGDLPRASVQLLGDTNGTIVYNLVTDVIQNSFRKDEVAFSPAISQALHALKQFNLESIYLSPLIKRHTITIKKLFKLLFDRFLEDLHSQNKSSVIFSHFLKGMSPVYLEEHLPAEIVRDFLAGMTDRYFLNQCPPDLRRELYRA